MPDAHTSADRPATLIAIVLLAAVVPTMLMVGLVGWWRRGLRAGEAVAV